MYSNLDSVSHPLRTLFVDFNAYFASVEQQVRPELRGRAVGVVPVLAETSCCIAASYEAKRLGIKTGTGVREARQLCPDIAIVEARPALYVEFHKRAVAVVDTVAPVRQVLSIDEMECELTGRWRERERAIGLAHQIKRVIARDVGDHLRVSIGIAPNTLLGKLASDMQKPDGLTVLTQSDIPSALLHLPVGAINGIGRRMNERLAALNITTMQALFDAPQALLHKAWGGIAGDEMYDKLRGMWYAPRVSQTQSLGHSHVLPPELRNPIDALQVLSRLTQKAAMRLRRQAFFTTAMRVHVQCMKRHTDEKRTGGALDARFGETQDTAFLLHALDALWHQGLHLLKKPLCVGVVFSGLVPAAQHTPQLFDAVTVTSETERRKLFKALDALNQRHGKNTVYFATSHGAMDNAPMRIAFTRIPDVETEG